MERNTTHRHLQLHSLLDTAESKVPQLIRAAANARRINNRKAQEHFLRKASKYQSIAIRAARRLAA